MGILEKFIVAFLSFAITVVFTPIFISIAKKRGWVDLPNERKIHKVPMPRAGGVGIFFGIIAGLVATGIFTKQTWPFVAVIPFSMVAVMGFVDDIKELSFKVKFAVQILASIFAVFLLGANIEYVNNPFGGPNITFGFLGPIISVVWIVGITNAINLSDGLDGLAAGISAIAAFTLAVTSARVDTATTFVALSIFASAVAFLRYNFHPAKIFMGDTGSQLLGFSLAVIAIKGSSLSASALSLAIPILAIGIPILDTSYAFLRRLAGGHNPFLPDKKHIHHQLMDIGFSHVGTVLFMYAVSSAFALIAILYRGSHDLTVLAFYVLIAILLLIFLRLMRNVRGKER